MTNYGGALIGKKAIISFCGRSWATIALWIEDRGFPARKIDGMWESNTGLITEWKRRQILEPQKTCQE